MADSYRELGERLGHDLGPSIALLEQLPTFMDGEAHRLGRKTQAMRSAKFKQAQLDAAQAFLDNFAATTLSNTASFDLLTDFGSPLFRALSAAMIPAEWREEGWLDLIDAVPLLFSPSTPLKRRFEINRGLAELGAKFGPESWEEIMLLVLGNRPLSGSLAMSLHDILFRHPGQALNTMEWPAYFTQSALHFFDRIALRPVTIGDLTFEPGERVRCNIHAPEWTSQQRQGTMFGVGAHLCLGRPLSELVWAMTTSMFSAQDCRLAVTPLLYRQDCEPFHLPISCPVTVLA